ncbi:MAG: hypothetical protein ACLRXW_01615 [Negativibacillus massiliensis]|uniref:hypothetical protein n=1 Tax=Negativibacillus massiliensis TaxID=1871035 RepID=UPI0039A38F6E
MKIYNKKSFAEGILMLALGSLTLIMDLINNTFEIKGAILTFALYFLGGGLIIRSLSLKFTKEDKLDKMDERNQLIELKSKSKAFRLTQTISFLLMLAFLIMGKISGYDGFIAMGIGLAFSFSISMFSEIFTYMYYESKN